MPGNAAATARPRRPIATVTDELSDLFTSLLRSDSPLLGRIFRLSGPTVPIYGAFDVSLAREYYNVVLIAARAASRPRRRHIYYYLPLTGGLTERRLPIAITMSVFIGAGIIIGHSVKGEVKSFLIGARS